ncbi:MAG: TonB family protein [Candidatus Krumholzibacteriia bacterium]
MSDRSWRFAATCGVTLGLLAGCASSAGRRAIPPAVPPPPSTAAPAPAPEIWHESPAPEGDWRPHVLSRCRRADDAPPEVERSLALAWDLYRNNHAGSDAIMELELCLRSHPHDGLLLITLGQMYLLGARGERNLVPREGPAAATRQWPRTRERLLDRAELLLQEARAARPDDGSVEYLRSDLAAARGDSAAAARSMAEGARDCLLPRSLEIMRRYQGLQGRPARLVSRVVPDYPAAAGREGKSGVVEVDLLIDPAGVVAQTVILESPDPRLAAAAVAALRAARFEPARLGEYPVWSWLRLPVPFRIIH